MTSMPAPRAPLSLRDRSANRRIPCLGALPLGIKAVTAGLVAVVAGAGCVHESSGISGAPVPVAETQTVPVVGYLLFNQPPGAIHAIRLPSLEASVIKPAPTRSEDRATIHALSGPDRDGRIAYIEDHSFAADESRQRHLLKTVRIDGTQDGEVFSRPGSALWATTPAGHGEIGSQLALSASGGDVAFLSGLVPVQLPAAYLHTGNLEVWNVASRTGGKRLGTVLDAGLAWFPDGQRLAFVRLLDPAALPASAAPPAGFGERFRAWGKVPAVFVVRLDTGVEAFLAEGWRPVVSDDGKSILVADSEGNVRAVDVGSGRPVAFRALGRNCPGLIASPAPDQVLALCRPDVGEPVARSTRNSPLAGAKPLLTVRFIRTDSGERQAVVRAVDPRTVVSFGACASAGGSQ